MRPGRLPVRWKSLALAVHRRGRVKKPMHHNYLRIAALVPLVGCLVVAVAPATEPWKGPDHLGKARLGMSLAEVQKAYPGLAVDKQEPEASGDLAITLGKVDSEHLPSLGTCALHFQFLDDKLYQIQARCQTEPEKLEQSLVSSFGPAHFKREEPPIWYWRSTATTLIYRRDQRQISLSDNSWAPALFSRALRGTIPRRSPEPTPQ